MWVIHCISIPNEMANCAVAIINSHILKAVKKNKTICSILSVMTDQYIWKSQTAKAAENIWRNGRKFVRHIVIFVPQL